MDVDAGGTCDSEGVKLTLTIDIDALSGEAGAEIGRILRYWGGSAKGIDWSQPMEQPLMDSEYVQVGTLRATRG